MSSKDFGLGPKWWQKPGNKIKKCAERKSKWCDPTETDGCCAIIPCTYCLELEAYGGKIQYGTADFATEGWEGEVGGNSFFGFWEKNYDGICEFVVVFNGAEVYRESCEGGQSCRDSSDEAEVSVGYDDYVLRWIKHEPLPLHYVKEEGTNCTVPFCDDCECSCECLCVTVDNEGKITKGEICNVSYPCDGPVWQGIIDYFDISLALGRDEYGRCVITPTVDGIELEPVLAPGCAGMSARIELSYTVSIEVSCKKCDCENIESKLCCGRTDLPDVLYLTVTDLVNCTCNDWLGVTIELSKLKHDQSESVSIWAGCIASGPCAIINGVETGQSMVFVLSCTKGEVGQSGTTSDFLLQKTNIPDSGTVCPDDLTNIIASTVPGLNGLQPESTCSPLVLIYRQIDDSRFDVHCQDPMAPPGVNEWELTITE